MPHTFIWMVKRFVNITMYIDCPQMNKTGFNYYTVIYSNCILIIVNKLIIRLYTAIIVQSKFQCF